MTNNEIEVVQMQAIDVVRAVNQYRLTGNPVDLEIARQHVARLMVALSGNGELPGGMG